uniref:Glycosyl transferase family 1 domain-containing protein n=3 Tax=Guillardia theta TaxID=55529 RepID=A0A7S4JQU8_GUITH|mmetsp:Transcript_18044/g.59259  ORF Transcript_18044/g.59259 Transcript_18044/m.59259 type:complete len:424 (+) Transcript_18044:210-1481(+)
MGSTNMLLFFILLVCSMEGSPAQDDSCTLDKVKIAFVHHALDMGGVERQIETTWLSIDHQQFDGAVVLYQRLGGWATKFESFGLRAVLFPIFDHHGALLPGHQEARKDMVRFLSEHHVAHVWYGGGALGSFSTFGIEVASAAGLPVIQNLAWNVFTVDLSVSVVVVECDETEELHRENLRERFSVDEDILNRLGVTQASEQQVILDSGFQFVSENANLSIEGFQTQLERSQHSRVPLVVRINPGVNLSRFDLAIPQLARVRAEARSSDRIIVGRLSRLVPEKDPETFVKAAALLKHRDDLLFRLWGDGPERRKLEEMRLNLGLQDRLELMGSTEQPELALAAMDIFAYPTTGESVGWVVLEAMAMELPVISTAVGAVPSFVRHGENGFLMEKVQDEEILASLIGLACYAVDVVVDLGHVRGVG